MGKRRLGPRNRQRPATSGQLLGSRHELDQSDTSNIRLHRRCGLAEANGFRSSKQSAIAIDLEDDRPVARDGSVIDSNAGDQARISLVPHLEPRVGEDTDAAPIELARYANGLAERRPIGLRPSQAAILRVL